jgi:electron transfer flavoprotein alpha subunit
LKILVLAETDAGGLRPTSLAAIECGRQLTEQNGGSVAWLLLGAQLDTVAREAARYAPVCAVDGEKLATVTADTWAPVIARAVQQEGADLLLAGSGTFAKDVLTRAAALLGGTMASDVLAHRWVDGQLQLRRAMYAGAIVATVQLSGPVQIITCQSTAYAVAEPLAAAEAIRPLAIDLADLPERVQVEAVESKRGGRPDVTEASVVVSGGRAIKNSADFEALIGKLADTLGGAAGSSRVLVDAGIAPNELQVGQTGKIVAPEVYLALGISGAVQHMAGMKNSKTIVAVNNDPDAPIFEVANVGLVGDVYEIVPQLIERLSQRNSE